MLAVVNKRFFTFDEFAILPLKNKKHHAKAKF